MDPGGEDTIDLSFRPKVRPLTARDIGDERVLFDERTGRVHSLNPTGVALWDLLDGTWSIEDLAGQVAALHGVDLDQARQQILEFVRELASSDLLEQTPNVG